MLDINRLNTQDANFSAQFKNLLLQSQSAESNVREAVEKIIQAVRAKGDEALLNFTKQFDQVNATSVDEIRNFFIKFASLPKSNK